MRPGRRRVAVTTAADRAGALAAALTGEGLEPVELPCIRVEEASSAVLRRAREAAERADLLLLTSMRSIEILWPEAGFPRTEVAAVGGGTAERARSRGGRVVASGTGGAARLIGMLDLAGKTVAYPHADGTDRGVLTALQARAGRVVALPIYRTAPIGPAGDPVDGAAFASPSAVQGWTMTRSLTGLVVGAIGPTTAAALEARDRAPDVVAFPPSFESLARELARHLEEAT
ncbi:MAG: uroporphyrinogen-III synthase [Acidimicrobiia bacterium]